MKTTSKFFATAILFSVLFTACQKDEEEPQLTTEEATQQMIVASEDNTTAEDLFQDVEDQVDLTIDTRGGEGENAGALLPPCVIVTVEPSWDEFPRTITIDFGEGCEGPNGRIRAGKIVVEQTAAWWVEDATRTATFVDFSIDGAQVFGTSTVVNNGFDANGNITVSRNVTGAKIIFPNGDETTWESNQILTQTDGGQTPFILLDNEFEITGDANGTNRNGEEYTVETISPIIKKKNCPWFVSGVIELEVDNKSLSLDYGNGICDRFGDLTLPNGQVVQIQVRRSW